MPLVCLSPATCCSAHQACRAAQRACVWTPPTELPALRLYWSLRGKAPSLIWSSSFFALSRPACKSQLSSQQSRSCMKPPAGNNTNNTNNSSSFQVSISFLQRLFNNTVKSASRLLNPITYLLPVRPGDKCAPRGRFMVLQTPSNSASLHRGPDRSDRSRFVTERALITSHPSPCGQGSYDGNLCPSPWWNLLLLHLLTPSPSLFTHQWHIHPFPNPPVHSRILSSQLVFLHYRGNPSVAALIF